MRVNAQDPTGIARALRQRATDAESRLWQRLRDRRLCGYKFRRQHPVGRYVVDFVCLEMHLVVELAGGQHALNRDSDTVREAELSRCGYRVLRFWDNDVLRDVDAVLRAILMEMESPHPCPLPKGARVGPPGRGRISSPSPACGRGQG